MRYTGEGITKWWQNDNLTRWLKEKHDFFFLSALFILCSCESFWTVTLINEFAEQLKGGKNGWFHSWKKQFGFYISLVE